VIKFILNETCLKLDLSSHSSVIQPASKPSKKPAVLKLVELCLNGCSHQNIVLSDPSALCIIYLLKYFHNFTEFIEDIIAYLKNCQLRAVATLSWSVFKSRLAIGKFGVLVFTVHLLSVLISQHA
jgi:hypothetical protein